MHSQNLEPVLTSPELPLTAYDVDLLLEFFIAAQKPIVHKGHLQCILPKLGLSRECTLFLSYRFRSLFTWNFQRAKKEMKKIYMQTVSLTGIETFTDLILLKRNDRCLVYSGVKNGSSCILKCYSRVSNYDAYEKLEFQLQEDLYSRHRSVPRFLEMFLTPHFRCYVIQRIEKTLASELLDEIEKGFGLHEAIRVGLGVIPILRQLHSLGYLYMDVSLGNIGYHNDRVFLFDFGAVRRQTNQLPAYYFTPRYASRRIISGQQPTIADDYESLGFLMLDVCYGKGSFSSSYTIEDKTKLIAECRCPVSRFHPLFSQYFMIIDSKFEDANLSIDLECLLQKY